jgi:hypothetical protein
MTRQREEGYIYLYMTSVTCGMPIGRLLSLGTTEVQDFTELLFNVALVTHSREQ